MMDGLLDRFGRQMLRVTLTCAVLAAGAACNLSQGTPAGVASEQARSTRAVATAQVLLTASGASASPIVARATSTATGTPLNQGGLPSPPTNCRAEATFVDDVTVNDGSLMQPGESFVKVWRLHNSGDCVWSPEYSLVFFGGNRLGAPQSAPLSTRVRPGQTADIALEMVAPLDSGSYQGYWKLQTPAGRYFGIGPNADQSFWVKIQVVSPMTATPAAPTASPTRTATPSPSITPGGSPTPSATPHVEGTATLAAGEAIDLDSGTVGTSTQSDLRLEQSAPSTLSVVPIQGGRLAPHSPAQQAPSRSECSTETATSGPIPLASLSPGDHLCYQTGAGRFGYLTVDILGPPFAFSYFTFAP